MTRRIFSLLLALCLIVGLLPAVAIPHAHAETEAVEPGGALPESYTLGIPKTNATTESVSLTLKNYDTPIYTKNTTYTNGYSGSGTEANGEYTLQSTEGANEDNWNAKLIWHTGDEGPTLYLDGMVADNYIDEAKVYRTTSGGTTYWQAAFFTGSTAPLKIVLQGENSVINTYGGIHYRSDLTIVSEGETKLDMRVALGGIMPRTGITARSGNYATAGDLAVNLTLDANIDIHNTSGALNSGGVITSRNGNIVFNGGNVNITTPATGTYAMRVLYDGDIIVNGGNISADGGYRGVRLANTTDKVYCYGGSFYANGSYSAIYAGGESNGSNGTVDYRICPILPEDACCSIYAGKDKTAVATSRVTTHIWIDFHMPTEHPATEPQIGVEGNTLYYSCAKCNKFFSDKWGTKEIEEGSWIIPAIAAHVCEENVEVLPSKDATCTEPGLTEGAKCSVCDEILSEQEEIAALGHTPGELVLENETATAYDKVVYCVTCNEEISREAIAVKSGTVTLWGNELTVDTDERTEDIPEAYYWVNGEDGAEPVAAVATDAWNYSFAIIEDIPTVTVRNANYVSNTSFLTAVYDGKLKFIYEGQNHFNINVNKERYFLYYRAATDSPGKGRLYIEGAEGAVLNVEGGCNSGSLLFAGRKAYVNITGGTIRLEKNIAGGIAPVVNFAYCKTTIENCNFTVINNTTVAGKRPTMVVGYYEYGLTIKDSDVHIEGTTMIGLLSGVWDGNKNAPVYESDMIISGNSTVKVVNKTQTDNAYSGTGIFARSLAIKGGTLEVEAIEKAIVLYDSKTAKYADPSLSAYSGYYNLYTEKGSAAANAYTETNYFKVEAADEATHTHIHKITKENEVAATCTEEGSYVEIITCAQCDAAISTQTVIVPATGHTENEDGTACSVCGEELACKHATTKTTEVVVDATCEAAGSKTVTVICEACGETISETTEEIKALGHTEKTDVETKAATCTEAGYTKTTVTCTVCGETISETTEEIKALGHTEETIPGKAATCTETGLTEGKKCSVCGEILVAQEEIKALGHTEETIPGKAATCTETGLTEGKKCSVCGEILVAQEEIKALGHTEAEAVVENFVDSDLNNKGSYDSVVYCSVCNAELSRETFEIPVKEGATAEVNGKKYYTLLEAWQNATANSTIKLLADVDLTGLEGMYVPATTLTLDLNEKTLYIPFQALAFAGEGFTIKNGTIDSKGASYGLWIGGNAAAAAAANVTIEDVTVNGGINIKNTTGVTLKNVTVNAIDYYAVWAEYNAYGVVIESGTYNGAAAAVNAVNADAVTVKGGKFNTNVSAYCEDGFHTADTDGDGYFTIGAHEEETIPAKAATCTETGLTEGKKCAICGEILVAQEEIAAKGHTEAEAVIENFKDSDLNNKGSYDSVIYCSVCGDELSRETIEIPVKGGAVAEVNGIKYATLNEALKAAQAGDTVKLLADVTEAAAVVLDKAITLDGQGKTLSSTATRAINVSCAGNVTIKNLTIVGTANTERAINVIQKAATLVIEEVTAEGFKYTLNVAASSVGSNITVNGGKLSGYAAVNITGDNTTLVVNEAELVGVNNVPYHESNAFAVINIGDETTSETTDNVSVTINGGKLTSISTNGNRQFAVSVKAVTEAAVKVDAELVLADGDVFMGDVVTAATAIFRAEYADELAAQGYAALAGENGLIQVHTHTEEIIPAVDATCTESGLTEGKKCSVCGEILVEQNVINAKGHTEAEAVIENFVDSDLNNKGSYDSVVYCAICGVELTRKTIEVPVKEGAVAEVNGIKYATLAEAVAAGGNIKLLADVTTAPVVLAEGVALDLNGYTVTGTVIGKLILSGGNLITAEGYKMIGSAADYYLTVGDVVVLIEANGDITVESGEIRLAQTWWTGKGQTLTIAEDAAFVVPADITLNVNGSTVVVNGQVIIRGTVKLYSADATIQVAEANIIGGQNIVTTAGDKVWYTEGKYIVHDHTVEIIPAVDATCTETGLTEGKKCTVCGDILVAQEVVEAKGHTEEVIPAVDATCTETGLTAGKKCSVCGEILVAQEEIAAKGHTEETLPAKAPTCTETGLTAGKKCSVCGEILVAQEEIAAKGHTEETIPGKEATCTETGLTEGKKCSVCGEILVAQEEIAAKGHTEEILPAKDPTCAEAGLTEGKKCSVCGEILVKQEIVYALGHTEEIIPAVEATCTENGLTAGKKCSVCGEITVAQEVTLAKGHSYENASDVTCNVCGAERALGLTVTEDNMLQLADNDENHIYHRVTVYFLGNETVEDIYDEAALKAIDATAKTYWGAAEINKVELKKSGNYVLVWNYNNGVQTKKETVCVEATVTVDAPEVVLPTLKVEDNKIVLTAGQEDITNYRAVVYYLGNQTVTDINNEIVLKAIDPDAQTTWGFNAINKINLWKGGNYVIHLQYNIGKGAKQTIAVEFTVEFAELTLDVVNGRLVAADPENAYIYHRAVVYYVGDELVNPDNLDEVKDYAITTTTYWGLEAINQAKLIKSGNYVVVLEYNLPISPKMTMAVAVTI